MSAIIFQLQDDIQFEDAICFAAKALREGKLVVFPTETVYGLGANAFDKKAVTAIFAAKERPFFDPLISHVADIDFLKEY